MPRDVARWNPQYHQIVLATDPIAYWIQDEKQGEVSYDWVRRSQGSDQDGAYTGATLGQPGIGDGRTSWFADGVNDFNNIWTPTFRDRFALTNHGAPGAVSESTAMAWARVANAGVWSDGASRRVLTLRADGNNRIEVLAPVVANTIDYNYIAGGVVDIISVPVAASLDFVCYAFTWSKSADTIIAYRNGVPVGTLGTLGVWTGNLSNTDTVVGARNTTPNNPWHGYLAHGAVWGRACPPAEILHLYNEAFR